MGDYIFHYPYLYLGGNNMQVKIDLPNDEFLALNLMKLTMAISKKSLSDEMIKKTNKEVISFAEENGIVDIAEKDRWLDFKTQLFAYINYLRGKTPKSFIVNLFKICIKRKEPRPLYEMYLSCFRHNKDMDIKEVFMKALIKLDCAPRSILTDNKDVQSDFLEYYGPAIAIKGLVSYEEPAVSVFIRTMFLDSPNTNKSKSKQMQIETAEYLLQKLFYNKNFMENLINGWSFGREDGNIKGVGKRSVQDHKYMISVIRDRLMESTAITINAMVKILYNKKAQDRSGPFVKKFFSEIFNDDFFNNQKAKKAQMAVKLGK
jgi:hypothetical protein